MIRTILLSIFAVIFLAACASTPQTNEDLAAAQQRLQTLENDAETQRYAATQVDDARVAVERAASSWQEEGLSSIFRHELYIAQRSLDLAEAQASVQSLDAQADRMSRERDRLRLEARASRAELSEAAARARAEQAATQAEMADAQAMQERMQREQAEQARQQAQLEREQAERERELAEQRRLQAEAQAQVALEQAERAQLELNELREQFADLQAKETERGLQLTLQDVLFDFDAADLKSGAERQMAELSNFLKAYPNRQIRIEGFTDSVGNNDYNQQLSERRADAVQSELTANGIDLARIVTQGYGEEYPLASNNTETGRAQNRRVEIIISYDDQPVQERDEDPQS